MYHTTMPFGKFKGRSLGEIPGSYLMWLLESCDLRDGLDVAVFRELADRFAPRRPPPPSRHAGLDPRALAEGIEALYRQLTLNWHPDRGGTKEAMQAINDFHDRLRRMIAA
jgi:hypothetical protein